MLGIMLRFILHWVIFILLIPIRILVLLWLSIDSIKCKLTGMFGFREYWGYVLEGMKIAVEADMDIIMNGW